MTPKLLAAVLLLAGCAPLDTCPVSSGGDVPYYPPPVYGRAPNLLPQTTTCFRVGRDFQCLTN